MKRNAWLLKALGFIRMALGTAALGVILGYAVGFVVARIMWNRMDYGGLIGIGIGVAVAYPLAIILGQIIFKKALRYSGSVWLGVVGVILTEALLLLLPSIGGYASPTLTDFYLLLAPVIGTAAFYLGRPRHSRV